MHAVIRTGGKQYRVAEGDILRVEKLPAEAGETVELGEVLLISDGDAIVVGDPLVAGGKVTAEVREQGRGKKIDVIKFKRRKKYRRKIGHRQDYTEIRVTAIAGAGTKDAAKSAPAKPAPTQATDNAEAASSKDDADTSS